MTSALLIGLFFATLRTSLPLVFASTGGYFSEKSGVPQIALESFLLFGAFTAATVQYLSGSMILAFFLAGIFSFLMSQIFSSLVIFGKANAIVIGTGLNLLSIGVIPLASKSIFDSTGSTPSLVAFQYADQFVIVMTIVMLCVCYFLAEKTNWGLEIKFAGEKSEALTSVGVSVKLRRWQAVSFAAFVTGCGGALLSTYLSSQYSPLMSAGRGYIALAAVIFAGWRLAPSWCVVLFFGFIEALQIQLQNMDLGLKIPNEVIQTLPYVVTLISLLILKNKQTAPAQIGMTT